MPRRAPRYLFSEMLVEEARGLLERFFALRHGLDAGLPQLAMHTHRIAEQEVARAAARRQSREVFSLSSLLFVLAV
jgi:hypothetical protein